MGKTITNDDTGQVQIETGFGNISKLTHPGDGQRNAHVQIKAEHLHEYPVQGWADWTDDELRRTIELAFTEGRRVAYRVRVHRKHGVTKDASLSELPNNQKVRDLELLELAPPSAEPGPTHSAPAPRDEAPPPDRTPDEAAAAIAAQEQAARNSARSRADEAPPASANGHDDAGEAARNSARPRGPRVQEARPWEPYNTDGSRNFGSYEFQAAVGVTELAHTLLLPRVGRPTEAQVRAVGRRLLQSADAVQAAMRADGHHDRMDNSHSRARGAIRTALGCYPLPAELERETLDTWQLELTTAAAELMRVATNLLAIP